MEKVIYWLKKLGILRSASYKVKGDASKLNEMHATDGGMIQSQDKIDKEHAKKTGEKVSKKSEAKKSSVLFWIFLLVAVFFLLAFLGGVFSFGSFLVLIFWFIFLFYLKKGSASWASSFIKVLMIGLALTVLSLVTVSSSDEKNEMVSEENNAINSTSNPSSEESYSAEMSAGNQFTDSGTNTKTVSMWISANVRMFTPDQYKKVSIKNVALKNDLNGDVRLLIPAGGYSEKLSKSNEIEYEVVEKSTMKPGTVEKNMAYMSIQVKTNNAFTFDTNKAFKMSKAGIGPSRTFQYVGLDASDLENTLEFDVAIEFESGEKKVVHFSGKIEGEEFLETGGVKNVEMEVSK